MKILHLVNDEKFVDGGVSSFEEVFPESNTVFVFSAKPWKYLRLRNDGVGYKEVGLLSMFSPAFYREISKFDVVFMHMFQNLYIPLILILSGATNFVWIGWGSDYYQRKNLKEIKNLFLPETSKLIALIGSKKSLKNRIKDYLGGSFISRCLFGLSLSKVTVFSPVLESEYDLVKRKAGLKKFPRYVSWNYDGDYFSNYNSGSLLGCDILVGNSSSISNNHLDLLQYLPKSLEGKRIVLPLGYGDLKYRSIVLKAYAESFGENLDALLEFLPLTEYKMLLQKCGFAVFGHIRQEALGNIIMMLYMGARVFLDENSPVYEHLKSRGGVLNSLGDLKSAPELLSERLTSDERLNNRKVMEGDWGRNVHLSRTRQLVLHSIRFGKSVI